jgi:ABC-type Fe3+/spermidine/putrescine transport system ATPase subunit
MARALAEVMESPFLEVEDLSKSFGRERVLDRVSFQVPARRTLSVLGRSGCGKTTLLKILAGLVDPDHGVLRRAGVDITRLPVRERDMVYLYQEALLFPHLDVFENVAFGLRLRRAEEPEVRRAVDHMLESLQLADQRDKMPHQLSGGQKQRVSFGRALIVGPSVLLLDEPFGSLDSETRASMQDLFRKVAGEYALTAVFVTHDLKEALRLGDALARIEGGRLRAYHSKDEFVADPESGVAGEQEFWRSVSEGHHAKRV